MHTIKSYEQKQLFTDSGLCCPLCSDHLHDRFSGLSCPLGLGLLSCCCSPDGALSYYCTAIRWQKFGIGTLLAVALAAFLLAVGECDLSKALLMLLAGVLSDVVRQFIGYATLKGQSLAYPVLSIGVIAWILPLWTRTEWYYQGATEEIGVDYANGLMMFASPWWLLAVILTTAVAGYLGIRFASKVIKSK